MGEIDGRCPRHHSRPASLLEEAGKFPFPSLPQRRLRVSFRKWPRMDPLSPNYTKFPDICYTPWMRKLLTICCAAAEGKPFQQRCNLRMATMDLKAIWEMSVKVSLAGAIGYDRH